MRGRRTLWRWTRRIVGGLLLTLLLLLAAGFFWLRSSLPELDGERWLAGLQGPVEVLRDRHGVPTIRAGSAADAAFALGFVHAQDRFAQMETMRRIGAGRLAEVAGGAVAGIDRQMRGLGLAGQAEAQAAALAPDHRRIAEAYAAGVNAWLANRNGALPWEVALLFYEPEPWRVADSMLWGRIMAFRLLGNWRDEALRARLAERLTPERIADLWPGPAVADPVTLPGLGSGGGSNVWAVAEGPMLANDPHLGYTIPNIWYLARLETPEGVLAGATAPGSPFLVLGHNGRIAWGMTTPYIDTADIVKRPEVTSIRRERLKVRWGEDRRLELRQTRNGVVMSDFSDRLPEGWAVESPVFRHDDRTPDALAALNRVRDWRGLEDTLAAFHSPAQNIAYADAGGRIGLATAGRTPLRRAGGFDASETNGWRGLIPFEALPRRADPASGRIVNANNRLVDDSYPHDLGRDWAAPYRAERIEALLDDGADHAEIQNDIVSLSARELLPLLLAATPDARLEAWNGAMDRHRPEPLIYMAWVREAMRTIFADELGPHFERWWAYRPRVLRRALTERPAWCDDIATEGVESCAERLQLAHRRAAAFLLERHGPETPPWGEAHRARFSHPIAGRIPLLRDLLDREIAASGGPTTVNRSAMRFRDAERPFLGRHGAGFRAIYDLAGLDRSGFIAAVGQSGNPFSPHYDDLLELWRDGRYILLIAPRTPIHRLLLRPA